MTQIWDAIVIGAGPAGASAAARLAEEGASVLVIDQQDAPGGQIYRGLERNRDNAALMAVLGPDYAGGGALLDRLRRSSASLALGRSVWRVDAGGEVWTREGDRLERQRGRHVVVACGAIERPVPLPGWTLPGVMTIGALQIMLKESGLVPREDVVLAGTGPLLYLYARQCLQAGSGRVVILDTATTADRLASLGRLPGALAGQGWRYLAKGIAMLASIRRLGAEVHSGVRGIAIEGDERVTGLSFSAGARRLRRACSLVALHEGIVPHQQMTRSLDCVHDWDAAERCFRPRRDQWGETSVRNIFVAGDAGGIVGARASAFDGEIAAVSIAARLGRLSAAERDAACRTLAGHRKAHLAVRPLLQRLYRPREEILNPSDAVIVCRCENVGAGQIRDALAHGGLGPGQVKTYVRTGMGPCQGRLCGTSLTEITARQRKTDPGEVGYYRIRSPLTPLPAAALAALTIEDETQ
ncbi:FAD/NAD(P)-dependent oxidoreductase [Labrys monachus]|uniref:NADPH-dependent 2,4-dienoyl-CoA reductase/sulfur reductase-like enzyme n=1 Tax=Labrys monachus TaxID=217067 RepID=A0ABU0FGB7_9HYPH|nr:NAD(P)/FAD-dependent oxidoreductase [Labrys monachus]MDQ0393643.1 NADPH-dependent 2,4-dienoyl-CoA reductase/sulfur reductase-like enzyme [Labrys monachus]